MDGFTEARRSENKKRKNRCLNPSEGQLNLVCGVDLSIVEAKDMVKVSLVGKIRGRNHTKRKWGIGFKEIG